MVQARAKSYKKPKKTAITFSLFWHLKTSSSSKIDQLAAISFFEFKGAWQTHFLSQALHILKIIITFEDVLLVVLVFFDIFHGLEDRKISTKCTIHSCSLSLIKSTAQIASISE